jgi:phosphoribosylformylglycinamidine synthase subunit PurQ / glutaminase
MKPKVLILKTEGTNCDEELFHAFKIANGNPKIVHINELRTKSEDLKNYQILAIPGGFSYGDDIVSGKILSIELTSFFEKEIKEFIKRKNTLVIGICNGFQVLVRTGLLPFGNIGKMQATLTNNDSGHFECRWINLKIEKSSKCLFLKDINTSEGGRLNNNEAKTPPRWTLSLQVAHGEGKFFTDKKTLEKIEKQNLVAFKYVDEKGYPTQKYPDNPNGSINAIAGLTDPTGRILGLMPHPERYILITQHPNWRRQILRQTHDLPPQGLPIFENMINYVKSNHEK